MLVAGLPTAPAARSRGAETHLDAVDYNVKTLARALK
jgi:hypothetical protein